jgi:hypothetical protein
MGGRSAPLPLLTTETQLLEMLGNGAPMMEVLNVYSIFHSGRVTPDASNRAGLQ